GCPFVKKHYNSGNMQKLQKEMTGKGIVWLSICSSAPGKQGYAEPAEQEKAMKEKGAAPSAVLLDPDGKVGRLYGAKATPNMYVIDKHGVLRYEGAIDDKNDFSPESVATAKNYVRAAINELTEGKQVTVAETKPYGCSIKYQ
ncbi:MAG TPA: redoxin domain-containing protein, partial [Nitrososphaera sp.]|nr:redoxin domain-containing protein [Nitrososphaera sp.]